MNNTRPNLSRSASPPRRAAPPAGGSTIAGAVAERHDQEQAQFQSKANGYAKATPQRPALLTADEALKMNAEYGSGKGRLQALERLVQARQARWEEMQGREPVYQLTGLERQDAIGFFTVHGVALAAPTAGPRQAPPNPIQAKAEPAPDAVAAANELDAFLGRPIPEKAHPTGGRSSSVAAPVDNAAIDREIVEKEKPQQTTLKGAVAQAAPVPAPVSGDTPPRTLAPARPVSYLEIEFTDPAGYHDSIVVYPQTTMDDVLALMKLGASVRAKLTDAGAKPAVVAGPAAPAGAPADGSPPKCKYHGAMKESKKPGTWFCPKKLGDGSYCDQKVEA